MVRYPNNDFFFSLPLTKAFFIHKTGVLLGIPFLETDPFWTTTLNMDIEFKTISAMVKLYCRKNHVRGNRLCDECSRLLEYARQRIDKCPFGTEKPVCNRCTVHCYKPEMREKAKEIMRYAGPRMLKRHPLLAIRHLVRSRRYSGIRSK